MLPAFFTVDDKADKPRCHAIPVSQGLPGYMSANLSVTVTSMIGVAQRPDFADLGLSQLRSGVLLATGVRAVAPTIPAEVMTSGIPRQITQSVYPAAVWLPSGSVAAFHAVRARADEGVKYQMSDGWVCRRAITVKAYCIHAVSPSPWSQHLAAHPRWPSVADNHTVKTPHPAKITYLIQHFVPDDGQPPFSHQSKVTIACPQPRNEASPC